MKNMRMSRKILLKKIRNDKLFYIMLLPIIAWYIIFCYVPMLGITLAFREFKFNLGIWNSPWVGMDNFHKMLTDIEFLGAVKNTLIISFGRIAFQMPCAIALAIFINEIKSTKLKKFFQTVVTFPHFISWVVLAGILINMFGANGIVNQLLGTMGFETFTPITNLSSFRPFIWASNIWKEMGWDSIIFIAAITSIDTGLYEAACVDGAGRFRRMWHITLPGIRSMICIMLILAVGSIMTSGSFDQIFNLYSAPVYPVGDTLDTYIFRESFVTGGLNYGYSTAIGLFKSVIGIVLITISNKIVSKNGESGLF
jgi:ABC-type polysaccharide transport system, permease component